MGLVPISLTGSNIEAQSHCIYQKKKKHIAIEEAFYGERCWPTWGLHANALPLFGSTCWRKKNSTRKGKARFYLMMKSLSRFSPSPSFSLISSPSGEFPLSCSPQPQWICCLEKSGTIPLQDGGLKHHATGKDGRQSVVLTNSSRQKQYSLRSPFGEPNHPYGGSHYEK